MSTTSSTLSVDLPAGLQDKVQEAKATTQAKLQQAKHQLHRGAETLQAKAGEATQQARDLTDHAATKLPEPVVGRISQLMAAVRRRPVPAVAIVLAVLLLLRRLLHRTR